MRTDKEIRELAVETLCCICENVDAPDAAKGQSARTLLEVLGDIGKNSAGDALSDKSLTDMTAAELDREIARLSRLSSGSARDSATCAAMKARASRGERLVPKKALIVIRLIGIENNFKTTNIVFCTSPVPSRIQISELY